MAQDSIPKKTSGLLSREGKITILTLLKDFYDEEIFSLLVKDFYNSDIGISEAAIRSSGSLGNEIAIPHLYQIIERGRKSQQIAAIQALTAIRAPSSTGMLVKYFNHFPEDDLRAEILHAINSISPTAQQVQELNHAVYVDPKHAESVKRIAVEALVEAERYPLLKESLPKAPASVQHAAFIKMLQTGSQEVLDFTGQTLAPAALGSYLCVYTLKAKNPQANYVLETLQKQDKETLVSFLESLSQFQGRLRYPTRVFKLLLIAPYIDTETEKLVGDFLKKIVAEVKNASPHLLSEFSVIASAHLDSVFTKVRKNFISLKGIQKKEDLLATVFASLLERYASESVLTEVLAFFKDDPNTSRTPPVAQLRGLLSAAPKEDLNRFEACIPLFTLTEKKDKIGVFTQISRADLNRPFFMRRLNRLIRVAGSLEIKTTAKKIQEVLDFARAERVQFLEETSIVTLCQLLTRSIIELSREYFKEPTRNIRSLNGYIRGARFIPAKIMIAPLIHILQNPGLNPHSRLLVMESLENMDLSGLKRILPPLLKVLDMPDVADEVKLRVGDLLAKNGDSSLGHQALDMTSHPSPMGRRVAVRILRSIGGRGEGAPTEIVTNRLYQLLEDPERAVRVDALLALLSMADDYAAQIVADYVREGDAELVTLILAGVTKPISRETFSLLLDMIRLDSLPVQEALRALLPELSQGTFAEELRQGLLGNLSSLPGEPARTETGAPPAMAPEPIESTLGQAKLDFKFKRENTQVLTVFFIDIAGYTEKTTMVDMASLMKLIKAFEEIVTTTIEANRGKIVKKMGDGILACFKHPLNATVAALAVQKRIQEYSAMRMEKEKFQARVGLNTGPVILKDRDIYGDVVNVASRMQNKAEAGDVYLTEATYNEIRDFARCTALGKIQVKGIKEAIPAYRAEAVTVDLGKIAETGARGPEKGALRDASLDKLKESIFVPSFQVPTDKAAGKAVGLLKETFAEISRAIEDIATDYHEEYVFKKYLQERWNRLMESL
jgi:class 3 adenylate cyclase/HEAT repeat protein